MPNLNKKKVFFVGMEVGSGGERLVGEEGGGASVSDFFTMDPNLK